MHCDVDDELPEKVLIGGASIKGSCSAAHTQNEMVVPSGDLLRKLVSFIVDVKELIHLQLEHDL